MNKKKVFNGIAFIFSTSLIIHDLIKVTIGATWTFFGFMTFLLAVYVACKVYEDFDKYLKNTQSSTNQSFRKGISNNRKFK